MVDLGAGDGALTRPLAEAGARVLAVEVHPRRAADLREAFVGTRVAVIEVSVDGFRWPGHPYRVVANPPYDGINALVRVLLRDRHLLSADLVVAEGAARGLVRHAARGDWHGRLTLELGPPVPRSAFRHRPPGAARLLRIRRESGPRPA